jgi:carotenoid cleavage dioxygenase
MQRRHFIKAGLGFAALGIAGFARADARTTYQRFHAALARDAELTVYANLEGSQQGHAHVEGRIPDELQGTFFRNGPGRFELGGERYHHWFDGDGYAQAWRIEGGTVTHQGRFVETRKFLDESAAGQFLYPAFGSDIARRGFRDNDSLNTANTNLLPFNDRLYALWEGGSATELDPATLATIGIHTWRDDLAAMPFSAHPKIEPDGTLWNFGALPGGDKLALYRIGADGKVRQAGVIEVPQLALQHDFAVSARHLVFLVPPYDISDDATLSLADRHMWAGEKRGARIVVVAKDTLTIRRVYDLPPRMAFHFGNAWDEAGGNVTQVDLVLHDGDLLKAASRVMEGEREPNRPALHAAMRLSLDHASGRLSATHLLDGAEFPRVMPQVVGRRHGRLAMLSSDAQNTLLMLDTVNVVDVERGRADSWRFAPGWRAEEHVLVPRKGARSETDGWLVGVAQDTNTATSMLTVFDAARVAAGPVALARLPYRTPHCFHGNFLAA